MRRSSLKRLGIYFGSFALLWLFLLLVVIPWDNSGQIPTNAYELIEGERAYAQLVREIRPALPLVRQGLDEVRADYIISPVLGGHLLKFGNVEILFAENGDFSGITLRH